MTIPSDKTITGWVRERLQAYKSDKGISFQTLSEQIGMSNKQVIASFLFGASDARGKTLDKIHEFLIEQGY